MSACILICDIFTPVFPSGSLSLVATASSSFEQLRSDNSGTEPCCRGVMETRAGLWWDIHAHVSQRKTFEVASFSYMISDVQ